MNEALSGATAIRLLVADDHPVVRSGVIAMLASEPDIDVIAEASDGIQTIELFKALLPDVLLLDLNMPCLDGVTVISKIRGECPEARILVLTSHAGDVMASSAIRAGAQAYLLKTSARQELLQAIRAVHAGEQFLQSSIAIEIAFHSSAKTLTAREVEVLQQVVRLGRNKDVAIHLGVTEGTVKVHMKSVLSKLGVSDRTQAVAVAIRRGIIFN